MLDTCGFTEQIGINQVLKILFFLQRHTYRSFWRTIDVEDVEDVEVLLRGEHDVPSLLRSSRQDMLHFLVMKPRASAAGMCFGGEVLPAYYAQNFCA